MRLKIAASGLLVLAFGFAVSSDHDWWYIFGVLLLCLYWLHRIWKT